MRIGHGYDAHRMMPGRRCVLCGVEIPFEYGPDGHSDADVALHALMDAMLGAAAMGDIGGVFPDDDDRYLDISSLILLETVRDMIGSSGMRLSNADITIVAQRPRLSEYIPAMRETVARALMTDVSRVSVKATTEEKMGFTGDGTGISAHAVVLLEETA